MATVDNSSLLGSGLPPSLAFNKGLYLLSNVNDFATVVTTKGSAIAASDVIQALDIPAKHVVVAAGIEYITAVAGGVSVLTVSLGKTGVLATAYLSAVDLFGSTVGTILAMNTAAYPIVFDTAGTLDILIASLTGALATGQVRTWALAYDVRAIPSPGLALLKS